MFRRSLIGALQGCMGSIEFIVTIGIKHLPITIDAVTSFCILAFVCYKSKKIDKPRNLLCQLFGGLDDFRFS